MADKTSASISYLDSLNNKGSKSITDISPTADNGAIKNFCVALNALTTNTIVQIDRIEKTNISDAVPKPKLTLNINQTSVEGISFGTKSNATPLCYGIETQRPETTWNFHFEKADGSVVHIVAPTLFFSSNWSDSTSNVLVYTDTTGYTAFQLIKLVANIHFAETDDTAATTYQLTIADGETTTFVQL